MEFNYDIIIIGAGPAGMTAGVYAARANMKVAMLEKSVPGGQMTKTAEIENYTGFDVIEGPDLSMKMFDHAQKVGAEYLYGDVVGVEQVENGRKVVLADGTEYLAKAVIIATGTKQRLLGVPGENELAGRGISWCAICDGAFFKQKEVIVVGGGNSAVEEALYLAKIASKVTIVHRRDELRADKLAQQRAFEAENIEFAWDSVVKSFNGQMKLESVTIENVKTGEQTDISADGSFIYIGAIPITEMVADMGVTDEYGYVLTGKEMETTQAGIYSAGDVNQKHLRQIATAVSDGAIAAQAAVTFIEKNYH
jgi:thioredoxin reductase (NADPH)